MALMNTPQLAAMLSEASGKEITTKQVGMWFSRRTRNGFPEPDAERGDSLTPGYQDKRVNLRYLWEEKKVLKWHKNYVPASGGRKPGPQPKRRLREGMVEGGRYVARTEQEE